MHNAMHGFVSMGNQHISFRDPFVLLLHSNVDRLFAHWQTQLSMPQRLDPNTVYGPESGAPELNRNIEPWSTGHSFDQFGVEHFTRPWCAPESWGVPITYKNPDVVKPPKYDSNVRTPRGINDGRPFWIGDFTGNGAADVLFYYPGDDDWWVGSISNGTLGWTLVGNTAGFGHAINDGRPFWIGDFTGKGAADVLFYYPGDDNWWLGSINPAPAESPACAPLRAQIAGQRNQIGLLQAGLGGLNPRDPADRAEIRQVRREIADLHRQIALEEQQMAANGCPASPNVGGVALGWTFVGNTIGFGHAINDGRPFWTGDFTGGGSADVLFYYPGDDNWWLGTVNTNGAALDWSFVGNTAGFAGR